MVNVLIGMSLLLECDAMGLPPPTFLWYIVNCDSQEAGEQPADNPVSWQQVTPGNGIRISEGNLTFEPATRAHRGCYVCFVQNIIGNITSDVVKVQVSGKL